MKNRIILLLIFIIISCDSSPDMNIKNIENKIVPQLIKDQYNVAFLIMNGTFNTELTAPYDIFQHTTFRKGIKSMNVFTVANTGKPIKTFEGIRILPDFNYLKDSLPKIDILVVPSAEHHLDSDLNDVQMINFVKKLPKMLSS
jgi:putative intracellular protease/amidase